MAGPEEDTRVVKIFVDRERWYAIEDPITPPPITKAVVVVMRYRGIFQTGAVTSKSSRNRENDPPNSWYVPREIYVKTEAFLWSILFILFIFRHFK